ncbi:MAG: hypothetical protein QF382_01255, partial [Acidimicrobiales bacterium]|nr:hypothetical protein [Acidimicrobiales bacterium]
MVDANMDAAGRDETGQRVPRCTTTVPAQHGGGNHRRRSATISVLMFLSASNLAFAERTAAALQAGFAAHSWLSAAMFSAPENKFSA